MFNMKTVLILCVLSFAGLSLASTSRSRGCIYSRGRCVSECEVGTHLYASGCDYLQPEPTCENPCPEKDTSGKLCDFSACYCDSPTVRNTVTDQCIALEDCLKY